LMDDSDKTQKPFSTDQPAAKPQAPAVGVPVAGKEAEVREKVRIEQLLEEIRREEDQPTEALKQQVEQAPPEELVEVRVSPEEEEVKISQELEQLGVQGVPPVRPPAVSDSDDDDDNVIVLPLSEEEIEEGLHRKVRDSFRWLAEWCLKIVKMAHHKVRFAEK
jgi:hypothetical protein